MQEEDEKSILKDLADQETKGYIRFYCPEFKPEFGTYEVKTRPPHKSDSWKMSMLRRTREQELREESMTAARLKCHESANEFAKCSYEHPFKETSICKEKFKEMKKCFVQEIDIELDKRRRDIVRNHEWWWTNIYDKNGEIGTQAVDPKMTYVETVVDWCFWVKDKINYVLGRETD